MKTDLRVIAFLSGKGGAGKTTVAISTAKLLADLGHPCLLVDLDLATHGASYFFKRYYGGDELSIGAVLERRIELSASLLRDLIIPVEEGLTFVPSRANLRRKSAPYDSIASTPEQLEKLILKPLISWAQSRSIAFVIIDCQAGYAASSLAASRVADLAVFVTEADSISSDATDNLLVQLGDELPDERRYLVNKIDVRDAETYRQMHDVFQTMNRLPPLPFDFSVRAAFGARRIPINVHEPSPLLFALFETVKYMLPDLYEEFEKYRVRHIDKLFSEYNARFEELVKTRETLRHEIAQLSAEEEAQRSQLRQILLFIGIVAGVTGIVLTWYFAVVGAPNLVSDLAIPTVVFTALILSAVFALLYQRRAAALSDLSQHRSEVVAQRLKAVEQDLDHYRSLLWARSKDYLIDSEIVKRKNSDDEVLGARTF